MISKNDCYLLLNNIKESGTDIQQPLKQLIGATSVPISVLKFINDNRKLDLTEFYTKLRKSYNQKHSKLYGNIVKDIDDVSTTLTTLSALLTQILLFSKNVTDVNIFLKHSRAKEISQVLDLYFSTFDITTAIKLLQIIKIDIKALESIQSTN